ncbi:MAG TPA: acyltransferase [Sinorhizobium sp.]|nr:acyltransferase [Sinorhizobium sp.]
MQYNPALDGLRAFAVLAVMAFHCKIPIALGGMIGVDLFFVLSGYLITTILRNEAAKTGTISLRRFYWRRALRLWPPLLLMLAGYAAIAPWAFPSNNIVIDVLVAGTYLSDYAMAFFWRQTMSIGHTWSLAVEEHFYLIWPLLILATRRFSQRALTGALTVAFVLATVWRIVDAYQWQDWYRTYYRFDTRASGLLLGSLIAVASWRPDEKTALAIGRISAYILIASVIVFRFRTVFFTSWGGIVADLASAGLILSVISTPRSAICGLLAARPVVHVGVISYSIYLWHYPLALLLRNDLGSFTTFAAVSLFSVGLAALSHEFVEKPLKVMRYRILPAGSN